MYFHSFGASTSAVVVCSRQVEVVYLLQYLVTHNYANLLRASVADSHNFGFLCIIYRVVSFGSHIKWLIMSFLLQS